MNGNLVTSYVHAGVCIVNLNQQNSMILSVYVSLGFAEPKYKASNSLR